MQTPGDKHPPKPSGMSSTVVNTNGNLSLCLLAREGMTRECQPTLDPTSAGLRHGLGVPPHDLVGGQGPPDSNLGETTKENLLFASLLEPKSGCL